MADQPREPGTPPQRERQGGVSIQERPETKRPRRYKVILYNDDYTPMEFVVLVLEQVFSKPPTEATQIMLRIHRGGQGVAGVFVQEIAETKVSTVHRMAESRGYPLRAGVEEE
jgi:ATP-dependent Clp protease adaptor protein ClpS